jgi:hypothetical protein
MIRGVLSLERTKRTPAPAGPRDPAGAYKRLNPSRSPALRGNEKRGEAEKE